MKNWTDTFVAARQGVVAVEFALLTPIVLVISTGIVNYADLTNYRMDLDRALRASANVAVVSPPINGNYSEIVAAFDYAAPSTTSSDRQLTVQSYCECPNGAAIACTSGCSEGDRQVLVEFEVGESFPLLIPLPVFGESVSISSSLVVRVS